MNGPEHSDIAASGGAVPSEVRAGVLGRAHAGLAGRWFRRWFGLSLEEYGTPHAVRIHELLGRPKSRMGRKVPKRWALTHTLKRQLAEGGASLRRSSAALTASIERDLKEISRQVASTRSTASALTKRFAMERQTSAKALRTKLEQQRAALDALVGKSMKDLKQDRTGAGQIWRQYMRNRNKPVTKGSSVPSSPASPAASMPAAVAPAAAKAETGTLMKIIGTLRDRIG